jgi:hypothetical protein
MEINMDLYVDHQVNMDVIYHDVTKTIFRMFANLMDNRSGWLSKASVCPRPKPLQLIATLDVSKIDPSLPSTTRDVARQCITECSYAIAQGPDLPDIIDSLNFSHEFFSDIIARQENIFVRLDT